MAIAGSLSCIIVGMLLKYYKETSVYKVGALMGGTCNILFVYFDSPIIKMVCLFMMVIGVAGAFHSMYVIMELRIPPENIGSASVLMCVFGSFGCTLAPMIS